MHANNHYSDINYYVKPSMERKLEVCWQWINCKRIIIIMEKYRLEQRLVTLLYIYTQYYVLIQWIDHNYGSLRDKI